MMRFDRFTERAQDAAQRAAEIIQRYGHNQIDTEHILLALIEQPQGVITQILQKLNIDIEELTDKIDASLVKTIVEISRTMGKKTVAEYVESMAVYDFVKQAGVDYAQGYGVCRPLPINYLL